MTDEVKQIDIGALATLTTGIMLCENFGLVHEAADQLLGHGVFTHEYIIPETKQALIDAVLAQYPDIPITPPADWRACRAELLDRYGPTVPVRRGTAERRAGPIETLRQINGAAEIIVLTTGE